MCEASNKYGKLSEIFAPLDFNLVEENIFWRMFSAQNIKTSETWSLTPLGYSNIDSMKIIVWQRMFQH
jgi:hypothetical protein